MSNKKDEKLDIFEKQTEKLNASIEKFNKLEKAADRISVREKYAISHKKGGENMGYQEVLVKSKVMSLNKLSRLIDKRKNPMFVDNLDLVATVKRDFACDRIRMFGLERSINPIKLKKGEDFLVITGERTAVYQAASIPGTEIYPIDNIMCSTKCIDENIKYEDIFEDKNLRISVQENKQDKASLRKEESKEKGSLLKKLDIFKKIAETSVQNRQSITEHNGVESNKAVMKEGTER